jgi:5-carboxymethyl-2-hydroxymuconate isomerase
MLYELIPNMPQHRLTPLIEKFAEAVAATGLFPITVVPSK